MKTLTLIFAGIFAGSLLAKAAAAQTAPTSPSQPNPPAVTTAPDAALPVAPNTSPGPAAAAGDRNQAVATTGADAAQPAKGANSFTDGEARRRIESSGYSTVADLKKDDDGVWHGSATKDGAKVGVWLDYKGNIGQQ